MLQSEINNKSHDDPPEINTVRPPERNAGPLPSMKGNPKVIQVVLLLLFILSFFTFFFGFYLVTINSSDAKSMIENMWRYFLLVPIPLASLILGIIYEKKGFKAIKNIVAGVIFTAQLLGFGSFTFIFDGLYSNDLAYISRIGTEINFDLPDKGGIATLNLTFGTQKEPILDTVQHYYMSDITLTDGDEISKFNAEISRSELWLTSVNTTLAGLVPSLYSYSLSSAKYDYFMIYNVDMRVYNTMPESSGTYRYIFIAYDSLGGKMKIGEYSLAVLV